MEERREKFKKELKEAIFFIFMYISIYTMTNAIRTNDLIDMFFIFIVTSWYCEKMK